MTATQDPAVVLAGARAELLDALADLVADPAEDVIDLLEAVSKAAGRVRRRVNRALKVVEKRRLAAARARALEEAEEAEAATARVLAHYAGLAQQLARRGNDRAHRPARPAVARAVAKTRPTAGPKRTRWRAVFGQIMAGLLTLLGFRRWLGDGRRSDRGRARGLTPRSRATASRFPTNQEG
jgi:hypothetical protein